MHSLKFLWADFARITENGLKFWGLIFWLFPPFLYVILHHSSSLSESELSLLPFKASDQSFILNGFVI